MFTLNCKGRLLVMDQPVVMGIINITPDSFYAGSRANEATSLVEKAGLMLQEGAAILDLGAQSTRPQSQLLSVNEELERLLPAIDTISKHYPDAILSVDTFYSEVAMAAVEAGARIVNDVSGGALDAEMIPVVGKLGVPYICMHMKGTPQTMQSLAQYDNLILEVLDYFIQRLARCEDAGIDDVVIDPGFGFAKTIAQNFELLRNLEVLHILNRPLLAGLSRKSTVYKTLGITASEALNGTTVLNTMALQKGASILRVHDVKEAVEAIQLVTASKK